MLAEHDIVLRRLRLLGWTLAGLGVILRLRQFAAGRPLWLDEAMVALNVLLRSYSGLLQPLDSDQTAPFPFLWAVKLSATWGVDERILRLAPMLSGVALLLLMVPLARRILEPRAAVLAIGLTAISPLLIYYSNEVKPYGLDAMVMAVLALLTLRVLDNPDARSGWGALFAAAIVASAAVSPVPFCLAGVAAALLWDRDTRDSGPFRRWFPTMLLCSGLVFLALYLRLYQPVSANAFMQRFWKPFFLDPTLPGFGGTLGMVFGTGFRDLLMADGGGWRLTAALLFLIPLVLGARDIWARHGSPVMLLFAAPWIAALIASGLRRYPFAPRLMLFAAPLVIVMVSAGVAAVSRWLDARSKLVPWFPLACAGLAFLPGLDAFRQFREPLQREAVGSLIPWVKQHHGPGDIIYVPGRTVAAWLFYTTDWHAPDTARILRQSHLVSSTGAAFYLAGTRGDSIRAEGDSYRFSYGDWVELVGTPPGHGTVDTGEKRRSPDPGWHDNEVRRMLTADGPELWLVSTTYYPGFPEPVAAPLEAAGATVVERRIAPGASITRYHVPDSLRISPAPP